MKKSLFAIAAATAFTGVAQAQSSVTVYGILDVGYQGVATKGPSSSTSAVPNNSQANRFSGEGSETTSRLGFRGTEDLGGGMQAFFTAEFGLAPTDYSLSGNNNSGLFNRQTFVGLSSKELGRAAIGTQYTPIHVAVSKTDPGQQNNMLGNVIYATSGAQGSGQTTTAYTVRYNNALTYQSPVISGLQLNAIYNQNNVDGRQSAATSTSGGANNNNAWGAGLDFTWKKLLITANFQASNSSNWSTATTTGPTLPATATNATIVNVLGSQVNMAQQYYGATYDFGILKAYVQYVGNKVSNQADANAYMNRTAQQIGVRGYVTKTIEAWASGGTGKFTAQALIPAASQFASNGPRATQNFTGYQLGANYWLSKRTNLYGIFGSTQVSSSAYNQAESASSYGLGVRHTF